MNLLFCLLYNNNTGPAVFRKVEKRIGNPKEEPEEPEEMEETEETVETEETEEMYETAETQKPKKPEEPSCFSYQERGRCQWQPKLDIAV